MKGSLSLLSRAKMGFFFCKGTQDAAEGRGATITLLSGVGRLSVSFASAALPSLVPSWDSRSWLVFVRQK